MKKIIGIGNALTDVLVNLQNEQVLERFGLRKGSMSLVDNDFQRQIATATADLPHTLSLGGSAGNTIRALAKLGVQTGFIGKVGSDTTGLFFERALDNLGITPHIFRGEVHSGRCVSLVSPDGERTLVTYLGAAMELCQGEITPAIFEGFDCLYVEGYLVASFNVVEENLEFLHGLVADYVDILFANEHEARAFTGLDDPRLALDKIAAHCSLTVVKIGTRGAYIKERDGEMIHVGIMAAARRVDTTGAGDFYAAGFLYGMTHGLSLRQCGTIGAIAAGKVIEVIGTTFSEQTWEEIHGLIANVKTEGYLF